ncbi:MAG: transglycosylase domain-containing protein [Bryobacterales bacterium]|nr:transglycosylase domain-containing protein [Bryobacterales bacterium]
MTLRLCFRSSRAGAFPFGTLLAWTFAFGSLGGLVWELRTSWLQSRLFAATAKRISYSVQPGAGEVVTAANGPYDERLGYARLPEMTRRLRDANLRIEAQARPSPWLRRLNSFGVFPIYREKNQAGLEILDRKGEPLFSARYPGRVYADFDSIPPLVVASLLFVENREILDPTTPYRNPAVEWNRLAKAIVDQGRRKFDRSYGGSGGSTLATQIEKIRHSPDGRTNSAHDKFMQMLAASLRAYREGEETSAVRRQITADYVNSLPLASSGGYGEVLGLGEGLWAWFGADVHEVNRLLRDPQDTPRHALAYRQVLALLLAINRPSFYLQRDRAQLEARTSHFLNLLAEANLISPGLRDLALPIRLKFRDRAPSVPPPSLAEQKATDSVRGTLLGVLGLDNTYQLDRLDLRVATTLDREANRRATDVLRGLEKADYAAQAGVLGYQMLTPESAGSVIYSFTLYGAAEGYNRLLVQADNYGQPLNINQGTRLELGSTSKLRTLATYLEVIATLHTELSQKPVDELRAIAASGPDNLTRWVASYVVQGADPSLAGILEAAMSREYSASPGEAFFTGGGLHVFSNFDSRDNGSFLPVREAFQRSTNLVFIRMMRDIASYHLFRLPNVAPDILTNPNSPQRAEYLARFADKEGKEFLARFYQRYRGMNPREALDKLAQRVYPTPLRLAVTYRSVRPEDGIDEFEDFLEAHLSKNAAVPVKTEQLYRKYGPDQFNLNDRGYLAKIHPLELWLLEHLQKNPHATLDEVFQASSAERQQVYQWLTKSRKFHGQNIRIRTLLESDAFVEIHKTWKRHGYPFPSLTPSYAAAIGSSGDNPAALAELMGIIVNGGQRYPGTRLERLDFGIGTPHETVFQYRPPAPERAMPPAVAAVLKQALIGVVEHGTARRAFQSIVLSDGRTVTIGGKTGTGDNRFDTFGGRGALIDSKVISRTAAFVFFIDNRFYGTLVAYVPGKSAADYKFTSALPVQIFRHLAPTLRPVIENGVSPVPNPVLRQARSSGGDPDLRPEVLERFR